MDLSIPLNVSSVSHVPEGEENWNSQSVNNSWKQKSEGNSWEKNNDSHWAALPSGENQSQKWPQVGRSGESFLKSLIRTPILSNEFPPPPPAPETVDLVSTILKECQEFELFYITYLIICLFSVFYRSRTIRLWVGILRFGPLHRSVYMHRASISPTLR